MNKIFFRLSFPLFAIFLYTGSSFAQMSTNAQMLTKSYELEQQYKNQRDDCIRKKDYKCASEALTNIIQMEPKHMDNYIKLGIVNYYLGNYQEAIGLFKRALDLSYVPDTLYDDDDLADAHMSLGITYHALGKEKEAKAELENALKYFVSVAELDDIICIDALLREIDKKNND